MVRLIFPRNLQPDNVNELETAVKDQSPARKTLPFPRGKDPPATSLRLVAERRIVMNWVYKGAPFRIEGFRPPAKENLIGGYGFSTHLALDVAERLARIELPKKPPA